MWDWVLRMAARARVQTAVIPKDLEAKSADEKRLLALSKLSKDSLTVKSVTTIKNPFGSSSRFQTRRITLSVKDGRRTR